jgi:putative ABC transport system permease protein
MKQNIQPPLWIDAFLRWRLPYEQFEEVQGDMHELYGQWVEEMGERKARWMYVFNAFTFIRPLPKQKKSYHTSTLLYSPLTFFDMLSNYFKIAFRTLWKNKKLSFINILGLTTGITCSLLIFLFVSNELSYDRFHQDAQSVHRVVKDFIHDDGARIPDATTPAPLAPALVKEIPGVKQATTIFTFGDYLVEHEDKRFNEGKIWRVDKGFFDVFTIPYLQGNPRTALEDKTSVVLTQSTAKRYFGNSDPIGKTLKIDSEAFKVTGIVRDMPANSHFHFDFLLSLTTLSSQELNHWNSYNYYTYIKVKQGISISSLENDIQALYKRNYREGLHDYYTQPLTDIHLTSHLRLELEPTGDKLYVYVFSIIGLFILLIAAINYINLSTAKSTIRAKEIGIRKVSGAQRSSLILQFLIESVIVCLLASLLGVCLAQGLLSSFNELTGKQLTLMGRVEVLGYLMLFLVFLGFVAGIFPALYLSSFKPAAVLKGLAMNESRTLNVRKVLVVLQFTISIALIIGSLVISQQMAFIKKAQLGLDKEQVIVIHNAHQLSAPLRTTYLNIINQVPGVEKGSIAGGVLGGSFGTRQISIKGSENDYQLNHISVHYDFLEVMGIELKEGRGFSSHFPADMISRSIPGGPLEQTIGSIIINETAAKNFGLGSQAIGKQVAYDHNGDTTYYLNIVGIVNDFHFTSLRNQIMPFGFVMEPGWQSNFTVKLSGQNISTTLAHLEKEWKHISGQMPFEYGFLDETFDNLYAAEARFEKVFISLVVVGIIIACLGLFALSAFAAQRRVKEVGIRKVLGASVYSIVGLLSKDFLKLVLIALWIAVPIAWWLMNKWLEDFAYRIQIDVGLFILAGFLAILIAFLTVSFQAINAARANPVKSLRNQ